MSMKPRILNERLAAIVSTLRHGEMIFIADAGSGTSPASLVPLDPSIEVLDLGVVAGVPSVGDVIGTLWNVGDFEAAIVTKDMCGANPEGYARVAALTGNEHLYEIDYLPDFYDLRDRVKTFVQTGDYAVHGNVILVAGYPSPPIPMEWLTSSNWFEALRDKKRS